MRLDEDSFDTFMLKLLAAENELLLAKADALLPPGVGELRRKMNRLRFGYYPIAAEQAATRTEARGKDGK